METAELFLPILKYEQDPSTGYLHVFGKMTGTELDKDQQRMDPAWLSRAVPEWFDSAGNIREMHDGHRAVGKAVELFQQGDDYSIRAKIVDKDAISKVQEGIFTGFSIGVRDPRIRMGDSSAPKGLIIGGRIVETSLVDRPALPSATFSIAKVDAEPEPGSETSDLWAKLSEKIDRKFAEWETAYRADVLSKVDGPVREALSRAGSDEDSRVMAQLRAEVATVGQSIAALEKRLAAMPMPGGPPLTGHNRPRINARDAQVEQYVRLAEQADFGGNTELAKGWRDLASDLRKSARKETP